MPRHSFKRSWSFLFYILIIVPFIEHVLWAKYYAKYISQALKYLAQYLAHSTCSVYQFDVSDVHMSLTDTLSIYQFFYSTLFKLPDMNVQLAP